MNQTSFASQSNSTETTKTDAADLELEQYDFGTGVVVVGQGTWDTSDANDFTKIVYVEFDDTPSEDSQKVSFNVRF